MKNEWRMKKQERRRRRRRRRCTGPGHRPRGLLMRRGEVWGCVCAVDGEEYAGAGAAGEEMNDDE